MTKIFQNIIVKIVHFIEQLQIYYNYYDNTTIKYPYLSILLSFSARDEARHGRAFAGLLKRYFGE